LTANWRPRDVSKWGVGKFCDGLSRLKRNGRNSRRLGSSKHNNRRMSAWRPKPPQNKIIFKKKIKISYVLDLLISLMAISILYEFICFFPTISTDPTIFTDLTSYNIQRLKKKNKKRSFLKNFFYRWRSWDLTRRVFFKDFVLLPMKKLLLWGVVRRVGGETWEIVEFICCTLCGETWGVVTLRTLWLCCEVCRKMKMKEIRGREMRVRDKDERNDSKR
jgi:hypothetical protein